jgi:hypothetical protein
MRRRSFLAVALSASLPAVAVAEPDKAPKGPAPKDSAPKEPAPKGPAPKEPAPKEPAPKDAPKDSAPKDSAPKDPPPKEPKATVFVEVLVLHATHGKKEIDERLRDLEELAKPPFSTYERYRLIDQARLPLLAGSPKTRRLPNGRVLRTELKQMVSSDTVRLLASINQPGAADFLPLLEVKAKIGQRFIVAGQRHKNGILVLVISVRR